MDRDGQIDVHLSTANVTMQRIMCNKTLDRIQHIHTYTTNY